MKKYLNLSIGIPAYNEEKNIKKLLKNILKQNCNNYKLIEIIVVSDKSTDSTVKEILSLKSNKIKIIKNNKRLGQALSQNKIINIFSGDILLLLNADVLTYDNNFITKLIKPFYSKKNIGLVSPITVPQFGDNLFEKAINYSHFYKNYVFANWQKGKNLYMCSGRCRAFSREFAKKIKWETSLSEDAYSYLQSVELGYEFKLVTSAKLIFKSPDNFSDHLKQSGRFSQGPKIMSNYFQKGLVKNEYQIPFEIAFINACIFFAKNPLLFTTYLFILLIIKINPKKATYANIKWDISESSKNLKYSL